MSSDSQRDAAPITDKCPRCGEPLEFDEVDIGVGNMRGNPGCPACYWTPDDTAHERDGAEAKEPGCCGGECHGTRHFPCRICKDSKMHEPEAPSAPEPICDCGADRWDATMGEPIPLPHALFCPARKPNDPVAPIPIRNNWCGVWLDDNRWCENEKPCSLHPEPAPATVAAGDWADKDEE